MASRLRDVEKENGELRARIAELEVRADSRLGAGFTVSLRSALCWVAYVAGAVFRFLTRGDVCCCSVRGFMFAGRDGSCLAVGRRRLRGRGICRLIATVNPAVCHPR